MEGFMKPVRPVVIVTLLAVAAAVGPCLAQSQSCAEVEQKVADLMKRVESLERRLGTTATAAAPAAQPAAAASAGESTQNIRDLALALYQRVDQLVAAGKMDQANQELAAWNAKYANTPDAGWTNALTREVAVVGKAAPADWSIEKWFQGEKDIKLDGKRPTLVVFWEAWCPHCKEEVPKIEALFETYKGKGLQVIGVTKITETSTEDSVKAFISEKGVHYPIAKENGDLTKYFEVQGIPAVAVVKDGKIVWRGHPLRLTDQMLNAWL
jgi:thiol-disulfide isomerase/thioredoxin